MSSDLLDFVCPHCQRIIKIKKESNPIGKKISCKGCQQVFSLEKKYLLYPETKTPILDTLIFICSHCAREAKVAAQSGLFGKKMKCKGCQEVFVLDQNSQKDFSPSPEEKTAIESPTQKGAIGEKEEMVEEKEDLFEFGGYKVLERLGKGGMGEVFRAFDAHLQIEVALKMLILDLEENSDCSTRFLREAKVCSRLDHPNIVKFYDVGCMDEKYYFTMELIEGTSFDQVIKSLSLKESLRILIQTAHAIAHSHELGILHRDLKPSNIMLTKDNQAKVMDFGLAKLVNEASGLTETGTILGTFDYMSPEQVKGKSKILDSLSDVYSLGIILYEILVGETPFKGKTYIQKMLQIVRTPAIPPCEIKQEIPQALSDICLKAIAKEKEDRYCTATDFALALEPFVQ